MIGTSFIVVKNVGGSSRIPSVIYIQNVDSPKLLKRICISDVVRIGSIITFQLIKQRKAKFSVLCDVISLVRLQGEVEIDHS